MRGDLAVRPAVGDQAGDFAFARTQRTDAASGPASLPAPAHPPTQAALLLQRLVAHARSSGCRRHLLRGGELAQRGVTVRAGQRPSRDQPRACHVQSAVDALGVGDGGACELDGPRSLASRECDERLRPARGGARAGQRG